MTREGTFTQLAWLQNNFPRQYPPGMAAERITILCDQFADSYRLWTDAEVMAVYKAFINEQKEPPAISEVRARLQDLRRGKGAEADRELSRQIMRQYEKPDDIVEHNGVRGRWMHREAIDAFIRDFNAGVHRGGSAYYYAAYPKTVFEPLKAVQP